MTVLYPDRAHIAALEGVPDDVDLERVALEWAVDGAVGDEESWSRSRWRPPGSR